MNHQRPSESFMVLPGMKPKFTSDPSHPGEPRLPGFGWLPNRVRHLFITFAGEFVGTFLFLFFAFAATQVANNLRGIRPMDVGTLLYISLAFGFSLGVTVWVFFRISGGLFNPAVTVAMGLIGALGWLRVLLLVFAQIVAAICAAAVVYGLFPGPLSVNTTLSPETSVVRGLFIEMFLTFMLVFTIFMLAAEKHRATFIAPIGIGLALFICELAGVYFTGGSLNPARSFGPSVVTGVWPGIHWIYWLGPLLGAILAVVFYRLMKVLEYETANPGADFDGRDTYPQATGTAQTHLQTVQTPQTTQTFRTAQTSTSPGLFLNTYPDLPAGRHATDGTNEHDFAARSSIRDMEKPATPMQAYIHGLDGHRSAAARVNHPEDRPRAHHQRRDSSPHESASDISYRNGPSAESGSSESWTGSSSSGRSSQ
ncbi:aquaporin-like protein [Decorospora gaudefroyi]|uniref:Aquaporin-like protein n=1 Tax=Decorospora gaudefroyi TaxID=184978 RepID=A0A6A5K2E0_9PLEO|nr:aquaporin-like protein [Decorospora gaudefroyi]